MPYRKEVFHSGAYYHLFNRGVNKEPIFFERENYLFFLRQMRKYFTNELLIIIAYCLMPNHYPLLIHLKTNELGAVVQRFALSYSKAINKRFNRVGSLFQGPLKLFKWIIMSICSICPDTFILILWMVDWLVNLKHGSFPAIVIILDFVKGL